MTRKATVLEELMLDELRHILLILRERWIKPKDYTELLGRLVQVVKKVEREIR